MSSITLIYEASDGSLTKPSEEFSKEYYECLRTPFFEPVLADLESFNNGGSLPIEHPAQVKKQYCILRSSYIGQKRFNDLKHSLKHFGYRLAFKSFIYTNPPGSCYTFRGLQPETTIPYHRYLTRDGKHRWMPDTIPSREILPAIAKTYKDGIVKKEDGQPLLFTDALDQYEVDRTIADLTGEQLDSYTNTNFHPPIWFERYVQIARINNIPIEWRAYYYLNRLFYLCPKAKYIDADSLSELPKPPASLLKTSSIDNFESIDYALSTDGSWWVMSVKNAQFSPLPDSVSPSRFLSCLAEEVKAGYDIPIWTWCVTARIVNEHKIGQEKTAVAGSRHFAPGEKVYLLDAYFSQGAERSTVLGKPKYSEKYTCVVIKTDLLENLQVERVTDPELLNIMYTGRLYEDFEQNRATIPGLRWGDTDKDYLEASQFTESVKHYRNSEL